MSTSSHLYRTSTFVVPMLLSGVSAAQPATDLDDHGNDPSTATILNLGETVTGEIDPAYDEDYFRLDLPRRTTIAISGTPDDGQSLATSLLRMEGEYETCLGIHIHGRQITRRELPGGTYYLGVSNIQPDSGVYEVSVREVGPDDHGDAPFSATPLALGETAAGDIEPRGDLDYFRFDLPRRMDVTVSARADAGIDLMLTDANGREAADAEGVYRSSEQDDQGGLLLRAELDAGRHYLLVWIWDLDEALTGSYEVAVRQAEPGDR